MKPELATFRLKKGKAFEKPVRKDKPVHAKGKKHGDRKPEKKREHSENVAPLTVKDADSPFAILEQLKVKKDASGS